MSQPCLVEPGPESTEALTEIETNLATSSASGMTLRPESTEALTEIETW